MFGIAQNRQGIRGVGFGGQQQDFNPVLQQARNSMNFNPGLQQNFNPVLQQNPNSMNFNPELGMQAPPIISAVPGAMDQQWGGYNNYNPMFGANMGQNQMGNLRNIFQGIRTRFQNGPYGNPQSMQPGMGPGAAMNPNVAMMLNRFGGQNPWAY